MLRNIKIYFSFLAASLKTMLEYRVDCIIGMISQIAYQIIELIFIWIIFQNTDAIAGWNFEQLLLLYGVMMLAIAVTDMLFDSTYDIGKKFIRKGKFDTILLRPVHPLISILGDSRASTALGYIVIAIIIIVSMLIRLQIAITISLILKIVFLGIVGGVIVGGIQTICSISGFWTYRSNEVVWSIFRMYRLAQYPIEIYNKFIRVIITIILPFAFVAYYPTLEYLNQASNQMLIIAPTITIIVWIIAIKVWNWGLGKYRSTGT